MCGLLGPNGAGQTTRFSIIANILKPDQGAIEGLGNDVRQISQLQGRMTILPQDALFQRNVPILDQLAFFRRSSQSTRCSPIQRAIERSSASESFNSEAASRSASWARVSGRPASSLKRLIFSIGSARQTLARAGPRTKHLSDVHVVSAAERIWASFPNW